MTRGRPKNWAIKKDLERIIETLIHEYLYGPDDGMNLKRMRTIERLGELRANL